MSRTAFVQAGSASGLKSVGWIITAAAAGLVAAAQPPLASLTFFGLIAAVFLFTLSPLAALSALLILAPMRTLIATEANFQLPLEIGQLTTLALIAAWLIYRIVWQRRLLNLPWSALYVPIIGFLLATGLTAFSAVSLSAWLSEWLKWLFVLALVVLVLDLGQGQRWEWIVFSLITAGVANALIGIYIFFGGSGAMHLLVSGRFFRAFGTFGQPNPFGGFMGLLAPIAACAALGYLLLAWKRWRLEKRLSYRVLLSSVFYTAAFGLLSIGVVISWSRGAWLAFAVSVGATMLVLPRKLWQGLALALIGLLLVGALWLTGNLPASITARIQSATTEFLAFNDVRGVDITPENYAVVERLAHWQAALNMAWYHPWFGVGFGNYEAAYPQFRLLNWDMALGHAHNYYLNVFGETGIIGLTAYLALWGTVFWLTLKARQHSDVLSRCVICGLFGTWIYLTIHSVSDNLYVNNLFLHLGVMLGLLAILHQQAQARKWLGKSL